jgi:hypothetical protein
MCSGCRQVFLWIGKAFEVPSDFKKHKRLIYKVLIRPVFTYASKMWTLSKIGEWQLSLFERKVLGYIYAAKQENGVWQKYSYELYDTFNEPDIVYYIKVN